jgi:hypothetical protein
MEELVDASTAPDLQTCPSVSDREKYATLSFTYSSVEEPVRQEVEPLHLIRKRTTTHWEGYKLRQAVDGTEEKELAAGLQITLGR